jgi:UDP-N-acetylmuramoyl-L-alanyl-D-glutamate--2,6-diaminopimelate ligase
MTLPPLPITDFPLKDFKGVHHDSRHMGAGFLFVALPGVKEHGLDYLHQALAKGAVAVLTDRTPDIPCPVPLYAVGERLMAYYAAVLQHFFKPLPNTLLAVTGTNGKTSVAHFTRQILSLAGIPAASLGTLGVMTRDRVEAGNMTTPDIHTLYATLSRLAGEGVSHLVMEASSHGLHQGRMTGIRYRACAFTNLSRDHLDYHGSMDNYRAAKGLLFEQYLSPDGVAVINRDASDYAYMAAIAVRQGQHILSYGRHEESRFRLISLTPTSHGQVVEWMLAGHPSRVELPLIGDFQASNVLSALGLCYGVGVRLGSLIPLLSQLSPVPGRMEVMNRNPKQPLVVVDYAHTPDGLEQALLAVRGHAQGQVWVVFGCGGNRDKGKRPQMGAVAARLADKVIVTDDNPRLEVAETIRAEIMAACPDAMSMSPRAEAVQYAVTNAQAGDVVLLAGKGHETGQIVEDMVISYSDQEQARLALGGGI